MPAQKEMGQSTCNAPQNPIGNNLELLDDYDDDVQLQPPPTPTADSLRRYPLRTHHPPSRFGDFIRH